MKESEGENEWGLETKEHPDPLLSCYNNYYTIIMQIKKLFLVYDWFKSPRLIFHSVDSNLKMLAIIIFVVDANQIK